MLKLKEYQERTLAKLSAFLEQSRLLNDPVQAFTALQDAAGYPKTYHDLPGLARVPYICLRLPTGGGKTLLSAYSVAKVANVYLETEYPLVLWLVPTDVIRNQTLETLKNSRHPNREALDAAFGGNVKVFDITEFTQLRPADMGNKVCIFVATFAALRVNRTEGRKVYEHHEELEPHFSHIPPNNDFFERDEFNKVKFSFVNLLAYYHPLVLIDEAHNHASDLSIEVLQRVRPAAIVEFTATPANNSNVLYKATASELKAEDMIKLPVVLTEHASWEDTVTNVIQMRQQLEVLARNEREYIRPIVLFQAENKDKEITVEVIRNYLIEQENIPEEEIAVATGKQRDLDGVNLFDPACAIKYVITVQALKEGWDCSFAYILCSVVRVQSSKDAEQLLGRVLRMPYAKKRTEPDLNRAYADVSVTTWSEAVKQIHDNLVHMGFEQVEAEANIQYQPPLLPDQAFFEDIVVYTTEAPDTSSLNMILQGETTVNKNENGEYKTTFVVRCLQDLVEIQNNVATIYTAPKDREKLAAAVSRQKGKTLILSPAQRGETFVVPQLCLDFGDGQLEIAEREAFLPGGWDILSFPVELENFMVTEGGHSYEIDIRGAKVTERALENMTLDLTGAAPNWTEAGLVAWFDRKLRQEDILHAQLAEFIRRHLRYLQDHRGVHFSELIRLRFVLEKALREKIETCREAAYQKAVQHVLFNMPQTAQVSPNHTIAFQEGCYPANAFYTGSFKFNKHFFATIADMDSEEVECAKVIDANSKVKTWVRNLEHQPRCAFWLPTSTDKFYPDFVARLTDGRVLAVEYKGGHLATNQDTREKDLIGQLWAKRSGGKCLFLMAMKRDEQGRDLYQQIGKVCG
jgi:type III restriction enzyme